MRLVAMHVCSDPGWAGIFQEVSGCNGAVKDRQIIFVPYPGLKVASVAIQGVVLPEAEDTLHVFVAHKGCAMHNRNDEEAWAQACAHADYFLKDGEKAFGLGLMSGGIRPYNPGLVDDNNYIIPMVGRACGVYQRGYPQAKVDNVGVISLHGYFDRLERAVFPISAPLLTASRSNAAMAIAKGFTAGTRPRLEICPHVLSVDADFASGCHQSLWRS